MFYASEIFSKSQYPENDLNTKATNIPQTYQNKSWSYAKGLANDENSYSQK